MSKKKIPNVYKARLADKLESVRLEQRLCIEAVKQISAEAVAEAKSLVDESRVSVSVFNNRYATVWGQLEGIHTRLLLTAGEIDRAHRDESSDSCTTSDNDADDFDLQETKKLPGESTLHTDQPDTLRRQTAVPAPHASSNSNIFAHGAHAQPSQETLPNRQDDHESRGQNYRCPDGARTLVGVPPRSGLSFAQLHTSMVQVSYSLWKSPCSQPSEAHDLPAQAHGFPAQAHVRTSQAHDLSAQAHVRTSQAHDFPAQAHDLSAQAHGQAHDLSAKAHDLSAQAHSQAHDLSAEAHGQASTPIHSPRPGSCCSQDSEESGSNKSEYIHIPGYDGLVRRMPTPKELSSYNTVGGFMQVRMSYIINPTEFYVNAVDGHLVTIENKLKEHMGTARNPVTVPFDRGTICAAYRETMRCLVRAKMLDITVKGNMSDYVEVQYIDYGMTEWVYYEFLYQLPSTLFNYAPQAYLCSLHGIAPNFASNPISAELAFKKDWQRVGPPPLPWSKDSCQEFISLTGYHKQLYAEVTNTHQLNEYTMYDVKLIDTYQDVDVDISDEMIKRGYAVAKE